ncbi:MULTISPECIES: hypothetical protein [Pseudomonas]|nr:MULTISPECIES: hypothetical protein [Pseudomonas]
MQHAEQAALQTLTVQQHNARETIHHWRDKLAPLAAQDLAQRLETAPLR